MIVFLCAKFISKFATVGIGPNVQSPGILRSFQRWGDRYVAPPRFVAGTSTGTVSVQYSTATVQGLKLELEGKGSRRFPILSMSSRWDLPRKKEDWTLIKKIINQINQILLGISWIVYQQIKFIFCQNISSYSI